MNVCPLQEKKWLNAKFVLHIIHTILHGMSTDRNWTSCMNLDTGEFKSTPLKQVQYGRNVCILN